MAHGGASGMAAMRLSGTGFWHFWNDRSGGMAVTFTLSLLLIVTAVSASVEYARAARAQATLESALDSATLAAARALHDGPMTVAQVEAKVSSFLTANLAESGAAVTLTSLDVTIDTTKGKVITAVAGEIDSEFYPIVGSEILKIGANASSTYESKKVELALVLDVTGSMQGQKLTDLKTAALEMIDTLLPSSGANDARVRISLVPFAAAVNASSYASAVRASGTYSHTCVTEAKSDTFQDTAPSVKPLRGDTSSCPSAAVMPLTNNRTGLINRINSFVASGNTAGHLGVRWGWFTISPNWTAVWPTESDPVAYTDDKSLKIIVFMTDGDFNKYYASGNGTSNQQAANVCTNAKSSGVTVYSVALSTTSAPLSSTGKAIMQGCATSEKHYYDTSTGDELIAAFRTIAATVQAIYLAS